MDRFRRIENIDADQAVDVDVDVEVGVAVDLEAFVGVEASILTPHYLVCPAHPRNGGMGREVGPGVAFQIWLKSRARCGPNAPETVSVQNIWPKAV